MKISHYLLLILALFVFQQVKGQKAEIERRLNTLNFTDELPTGILSSKTVVLVKVPPKSLNPEVQGDYNEIAKVTQKGFHKAKIDAVTYYHIGDVTSGPEAYVEYLNGFDKRNLSHGAILSQVENGYELILLKFTDRQFLITEGQEAFKMKNESLERLMELLYRKAANSGLEKSNLLIIETPEYAKPVDIISGKRSEFYDLNFKSEKLAVPMFADTSEINKVMAKYPFKWEFVSSEKPEDEIRKDGFQYILYYVNGTAKNARIMLDYEVKENENAFASEVKQAGQSQVTSQNASAIVYKFYIKHIRTRNSFIGKRWDSGYTWQEGLENYIDNLRNEILR